AHGAPDARRITPRKTPIRRPDQAVVERTGKSEGLSARRFVVRRRPGRVNSMGGGGRPDKKDRMKILITGGAGFIGSAVVRRAVADGHEVVNLDALTYSANLENVASVAD